MVNGSIIRIARSSTSAARASSARHPSRNRFLAELTLDLPGGTGDDAGAPQKDEDYRILSTMHSAKGQEWRAVTLLNAVNGCIPQTSPPATRPSWKKSGACCTWR